MKIAINYIKDWFNQELISAERALNWFRVDLQESEEYLAKLQDPVYATEIYDDEMALISSIYDKNVTRHQRAMLTLVEAKSIMQHCDNHDIVESFNKHFAHVEQVIQTALDNEFEQINISQEVFIEQEIHKTTTNIQQLLEHIDVRTKTLEIFQLKHLDQIINSQNREQS